MFQASYQNVKSSMRYIYTMSYSELFDVTLGVKPKMPLAPLLFISLINDVTDCIHSNNLLKHDLRPLSIYTLLFADDFALFTINLESVKLQLNALRIYNIFIYYMISFQQ